MAHLVSGERHLEIFVEQLKPSYGTITVTWIRKIQSSQAYSLISVDRFRFSSGFIWRQGRKGGLQDWCSSRSVVGACLSLSAAQRSHYKIVRETTWLGDGDRVHAFAVADWRIPVSTILWRVQYFATEFRTVKFSCRSILKTFLHYEFLKRERFFYLEAIDGRKRAFTQSPMSTLYWFP